jgi:hypothetical protein
MRGWSSAFSCSTVAGRTPLPCRCARYSLTAAEKGCILLLSTLLIRFFILRSFAVVLDAEEAGGTPHQRVLDMRL